ncbi:class I adenylate-forming enzyme family protein [Celeribacter sp.]|uniref:class I adenylate-forming enzyme family protein n=1 Tax=Celeribacter sp. TaxID=1890673 RepID=UPI003A8EFE84
MQTDNQTNLADTFHALGASFRDRSALVSGARSVSFAELVEIAAQWARQFQAEGLEAGDQVGLALRDSIDTVIAMVGLWMMDAVAVPIDFRNRGDERTRLAEEFDLAAILEDRDQSNGAYRSIVCHAGWKDVASQQPKAPIERFGAVSYPALISLTSGTTGRPLGIVAGHRTILLRSMGYGFEADYPFGGAFLNAYPLSFSASRNHTIGQLMRGATVHFHPPIFSPEELIEKVNSLGVTFLFAVPATVKAMLALSEGNDEPLMPNLKMLYCGGSGMEASDKRRAARELTPGFLHCFSSSVSGTCSVLSGTDVETRSDTDGRVLPTVRIEIVDENHQPLPAGDVGAMRVRSHGMAEGLYKNRARETGDKIRDGWAYTGDLAKLSPDGFLSIVGRSSDLIIRGGANVYPAEIETVLSGVSGVEDVAVTGFDSAEFGEEIAAFVVTCGDVSEGDLAAECRVQLSSDKRPRKFVFLDSLPRNTNGKILRRELRAMLED